MLLDHYLHSQAFITKFQLHTRGSCLSSCLSVRFDAQRSSIIVASNQTATAGIVECNLL